MANIVFTILRDLYVVLLVMLVIEQIPGGDLLHDVTRKAVIAVTVIVIFVKVVQPFFFGEDATGRLAGRSSHRQKKMDGGKTPVLEWASAEMQGWRPAMEDAACVVPSLGEPLSNQTLFAVFDGHGGSQVSLIASREFPKVLAACAGNVFKSDEKEEGASDEAGDSYVAKLGKSLHMAMLTMDSVLRKGGNGAASKSTTRAEALGLIDQVAGDQKNAFNLVGSTAIVVLIDSDAGRVVVANCGDSRAILCRAGKAIELSQDHKPELKEEEERIRRAGGHVAMVGPCHRIDGWGLNLSRALGDFHYKARTDLPPEKQKVCAVPEIKTLELNDEDEFMVLACDGIFELHTSQNVVNLVRQNLQTTQSVEKAVEELVDRSCSPNLMRTQGKGGDNCSAIVLKFLR